MTTTRSDWKSFEQAGLLWFVNRILHVFGWVIVISENEDACFIEAWPARTTMLGFELEVDEAGRKKFVEAQRRNLDGGF